MSPQELLRLDLASTSKEGDVSYKEKGYITCGYHFLEKVFWYLYYAQCLLLALCLGVTPGSAWETKCSALVYCSHSRQDL